MAQKCVKNLDYWFSFCNFEGLVDGASKPRNSLKLEFAKDANYLGIYTYEKDNIFSLKSPINNLLLSTVFFICSIISSSYSPGFTVCSGNSSWPGNRC